MRDSSIKFTILLLVFGIWMSWLSFGWSDEGSVRLLTTYQAKHKRMSYLYTPSSYKEDKKMPLLLAFHGYLGSAEQMMRMTEFNTLAEKEDFLVVYPETLREKWNANLGKSESSNVDIQYVSLLIDQISKERNVDPERIYATGFSSGGFFSQRLACEMPDKIAAIASVSATLGDPVRRSCKSGRAIPFLTINGTQDPIITWDGHVRKIRYAFKDADITSVPTMVRFWKTMNHCQDVKVKDEKASSKPVGPKITKSRYDHCTDDANVEQIIIYDGGHTWPGSKVNFRLAKHVLGYTSQDVYASKVIWDFLEKHPMPEKPKEKEVPELPNL